MTYLTSLRGAIAAGLALASAALSIHGSATEPPWWSGSQTGIWMEGSHPDAHNSPANVGQLKHVTTQARNYLDAMLALSPLHWDLAYFDHQGNPFPFATGPDPENNAPANVGQLKYLATGFYEILNHVEGFSVSAFLDSQGVPSANRTSGFPVFPWSDSAPALENNSMANIGQLKLVFSFSLDALANPQIDPEWEMTYFSKFDVNPLADPDEDDLNNMVELLLRTDPDNPTQNGGPQAPFLLVF